MQRLAEILGRNENHEGSGVILDVQGLVIFDVYQGIFQSGGGG